MFSPQTGPGRIAAYIRWSTDEQGHGTTLEVQQERVALFIRSQGWQLREDYIYVDDGYSGGTLDRPGLSQLRRAICAGEVDCVVVYRLDRLSRSLLDTVNLVRREWEGKAVLCSATENFDTHSPVGQMIFNMLASFAEFERSLIRERTLSGKRKRAEQGRNAGQRYPLGYRKGPGGTWALDARDEESGSLTGPACLVRHIFDAFLSGMGTGTIARMLNSEGRPTPQGCLWRFHYISRILRNPLYAGSYRYGRNGLHVAEAAPAIVSAEEFGQVQRLLEAHRSPRTPAVLYLLSGLARCSRCGSPVAGSRAKSKRYYVCIGRTLLHQCDCAYVPADPVETAVCQELRRHADRLHLTGSPVRLQERWEEEVSARRQAVFTLERNCTDLGRRRHRAEDEFLHGRLEAQAFSRLAERLAVEEQELLNRLGQAREALATLEVEPAEWREQVPACDPWDELSPEDLYHVLRLLTGSLTLYRAPGSDLVQVSWAPRAKDGFR